MTRFGYEIVRAKVKRGIEDIGLRPFSRKLGVPVGVLRSVNDGREIGVTNLIDLCERLGVSLYIGPPRPKAPVPPVTVDSREYAPVPQYDAHLSAGDGVFNLNAEPIDHLAFSRAWMAQRGLKADKAILVSVRGDSMQPAICDGDLVLIDRQKTEIDNGKIHAFNDIGGDAKIKRLELIPGTALALRSDNPDFATLYRKGNDMNFIASGIIGRVVWVGHDLK